jgi:hypothetical protein
MYPLSLREELHRHLVGLIRPSCGEFLAGLLQKPWLIKMLEENFGNISTFFFLPVLIKLCCAKGRVVRASSWGFKFLGLLRCHWNNRKQVAGKLTILL